MKSSTVILSVLVTLSLVISLTALLLVATQNNNSLTPNPPTPTLTITPTTPQYTTPTITDSPPSPTPTITPEPTPTTPPPQTELTLLYEEIDRVENNGITKVTLTIDLNYTSGPPITIKYSQFCLQLGVWRTLIYFGAGTVETQNSGSFTLDSSHKIQTFQLTFEFQTMGHNGMDPAKHWYQLYYDGPAVIEWKNQKYH
jgi:hypothetical protein